MLISMVSCYYSKEGTVVDFDSAKKVVKIKFSESCLKRLARKG